MSNVYGVMHSSMLNEANMDLTFEAVDNTFIALKAANNDELFEHPLTEHVIMFEGRCGGKNSDDEDEDDDEFEGDDDDDRECGKRKNC